MVERNETYLACDLALRVGEILLSSGAGAADVTATISLPQMKTASEWISESALKIENGKTTLQIPPGGLAIVEIR